MTHKDGNWISDPDTGDRVWCTYPSTLKALGLKAVPYYDETARAVHTTEHYRRETAIVKSAIAHGDTAKQWNPDSEYARGYDQCTRDLARDLADILAADDPEFVRNVFLTNCGVTAKVTA